jgi:cis-3-alkyl-4-acyloxetan-2-one decarboxylase
VYVTSFYARRQDRTVDRTEPGSRTLRELPTSYLDGIRYHDSGRRAGPSFLLVHGLGNSLQFWADVAPRLAEHGRVVALDIPGFGKSRAPTGKRLGVYVEPILDLVARLGLEGVHVVGHSMGSVVATSVAALTAPRVATVLLLDGVPFRAIDIVRSVPTAIRYPGVATNLVAQFVGGSVPLGTLGASILARSAVLRWLSLWPFVHDPVHVDPDLLRVALADNGGLGAVRAACIARWTPLEELLAVPSAPTRVMWGEHDRLVGADDIERSVARYEVVDSHMIPSIGHWPMIEAPGAVASYIESYSLDG